MQGEEPAANAAAAGIDRNLALRIAAACVMAPLGVWAIWTGGEFLYWATTICAVIAAFEWARMALGREQRIVRPIVTGVLAAGAVAATSAAASPLMVLATAAMTACFAGAAAMVVRTHPLSIAFGGFYVTLPFAAFLWIRDYAPGGRDILLCVLAVVAVTDIAAYLAGRGFGGPRLAPRRSPNKTWTGASGALLCAALAGAVCWRFLGGSLLAFILAGVAISIVAQAGDLLESAFKRRFDVKDASGLIPGHGGVLDRLDGLMAACVVTALLLLSAPGIAAFIGAG